MALLGVVALATLAANGSRQLRYSAAALVGVSLAANVIGASAVSNAQVAVAGCAALVACGILFVAARDASYGEDPGWRLWVATVFAAAATAATFASLRTATSESVDVPFFGDDRLGVTAQVAAFWLISSGVAILFTARGAVRGSLGALLMITGVQILVRLVPVPHLALTLMLSWLEVVIALAGSFLIVNERAAREA